MRQILFFSGHQRKCIISQIIRQHVRSRTIKHNHHIIEETERMELWVQRIEERARVISNSLPSYLCIEMIIIFQNSWNCSDTLLLTFVRRIAAPTSSKRLKQKQIFPYLLNWAQIKSPVFMVFHRPLPTANNKNVQCNWAEKLERSSAKNWLIYLR